MLQILSTSNETSTGPELVKNGDFSATGSELLTNGASPMSGSWGGTWDRDWETKEIWKYGNIC